MDSRVIKRKRALDIFLANGQTDIWPSWAPVQSEPNSICKMDCKSWWCCIKDYFNFKELLIWAKNTPMKNLSSVSGCYLKCDRVKVRGFSFKDGAQQVLMYVCLSKFSKVHQDFFIILKFNISLKETILMLKVILLVNIS